MFKRVHILIFGQVQGVSFRYFATREANLLGITGWVRNKPDGSVEIEVEGKQEDLKDFIKWCYNGPEGAIIEDIKEEWKIYKGEFDKFEIVR